jgi:hypothetical protein
MELWQEKALPPELAAAQLDFRGLPVAPREPAWEPLFVDYRDDAGVVAAPEKKAEPPASGCVSCGVPTVPNALYCHRCGMRF